MTPHAASSRAHGHLDHVAGLAPPELLVELLLRRHLPTPLTPTIRSPAPEAGRRAPGPIGEAVHHDAAPVRGRRVEPDPRAAGRRLVHAARSRAARPCTARNFSSGMARFDVRAARPGAARRCRPRARARRRARCRPRTALDGRHDEGAVEHVLPGRRRSGAPPAAGRSRARGRRPRPTPTVPVTSPAVHVAASRRASAAGHGPAPLELARRPARCRGRGRRAGPGTVRPSRRRASMREASSSDVADGHRVAARRRR